WQRIENQIDTAFIFARADFVNETCCELVITRTWNVPCARAFRKDAAPVPQFCTCNAWPVSMMCCVRGRNRGNRKIGGQASNLDRRTPFLERERKLRSLRRGSMATQLLAHVRCPPHSEPFSQPRLWQDGLFPDRASDDHFACILS